ncbi:MAG TPA: glycosyltransferase, partial [Longimicrobiales bacterium]|nr:glycosyltransferase [Longimicrobiales bacterium]
GAAESALLRALRRRGATAALLDDRRLAQLLGTRGATAWLRARGAAFRPDRIILGKARGIRPAALARLSERVPTALWYQDLRVPPDPGIVALARAVRVLFLTAGGQAPAWRALGVETTRFLPGAADPELDRPVAPEAGYDADVAFIGSGYDAYRAELLCRLAERFRVRVWGPGWERWGGRLGWTGQTARPEDFPRICASARIVLGVNPSFQVDTRVWGYASNRMWRVVASGGFYLGHATPGARWLLRDGEHCAFYDDEPDALRQIERYLGDDALRRRVREEGGRFVRRHHTFDRRLDNLLTGRGFENPLAA